MYQADSQAMKNKSVTFRSLESSRGGQQLQGNVDYQTGGICKCKEFYEGRTLGRGVDTCVKFYRMSGDSHVRQTRKSGPTPKPTLYEKGLPLATPA